MQDFEKLGLFYLGQEYDLANHQTKPSLLLYDAKDLTTHAVCVGMTGSGKTGLCLALLEEAAIDGIPVIAVDPKGDLGNLLLAFPQFRPADFRPWIDEGAAARKGITPDQLAAETARAWRDGLAEAGQDGARIERYLAAAEATIYTPGSSTGIPLTVLKSFAAPSQSLADDADAFRAHLTAAAAGLLALLGIDADPIRSPEHILLATILDRAWRAGRDLDLPSLLREIQTPPFDKVGFVDLETFFPAKDRHELSMRLNNLMSSPSFAGWLEGEPLDVRQLLHAPDGRPRVSIISIAHLSDAERMFFVTLLLNEVLAWVRSQPGTSSLRAILYMDEVFGFFPPTANPPSKAPMLTLLKQARAFGLGIVLATQNPVDLDYKGLSNAGTWFLGRLQTERDKLRVLDGLEGASAAAGAALDRGQIETILSSLESRVFLMHNVHDDHPVVFRSRWTLSYLRGPLSRGQIRELMVSRKQAVAQAPVGPAAAAETAPGARPDVASTTAVRTEDRPIVPPDAGERFFPGHDLQGANQQILYRPALWGEGRLHFVDTKCGVDTWKDLAVWASLDAESLDDPWEKATLWMDDPPEFEQEPVSGATFAPLPAVAANAKKYAAWQKTLQAFLYRSQVLRLWKCPPLKLVSNPAESEAEFRIRLRQQAREQRDAEVEKLRGRYGPKLKTLEDQVRRAAERVSKEESQFTEQSWRTAVSLGSTLLGALLGRKVASRTNVTGAASTARGMSRAAQERGDVGRAKDNLAALEKKLADLEQELHEEVANLEDHLAPDRLELVTYDIHPRKSDLTVQKPTLVWMPSRGHR